VPSNLRRFLPLMLVLMSAPAWGDSWTKPTSEELQMTAEPAAPGAAAIYLLRDERADDKLHARIIYVRLKVLTEKGKEYADQDISYEGATFRIFGVEGRTIHSDGTVIPFTGKPYEKVLQKGGPEKYKATVFTLPDVQVGSILEYRYVLGYESNIMVSPRWFLQGPLYTRKGHFVFVPSERVLNDGHGGLMQGHVANSAYLPAGTSVVYNGAAKYYSLDVQNIPPAPDEEFMPPMHNYVYRALFYYTTARTLEEYWGNEGKYWSKEIDRFIDAGKLANVVNQIVAPSDTPAQKLQKIYDAVMRLENTSFTREHTTSEDKALGIRVKTAADIWEQKRGNRDELTRLFVGLARAAGLKAYVAVVTNRDRNLFVQDYLDMHQLDDDIAIAQVDGKDLYFDPGERYATFGELHWKHSATQGIRQADKGTAIFETPTPAYKETTIVRNADLAMESNGTVTGSIRVIFTGSRALHWRQRALRTDEDALKQEFQEQVQTEVPAGIQVKFDHFLGLTDWQTNLQGVLKVTGSMGTVTARRVFVPATFFETNSHPLFALGKRTLPVDLDYPYGGQDNVTIRVPPTFTIESLPKDAEITFPQNAFYRAKFSQDSSIMKNVRVFVIGNVVFGAEEYPALKDFYQKVNAKDKEPAVLQLTQTANGSGGTPAGSTAAARVP
jgi:Domain of Unknown Function with PDB structure (DUF3857)/Transglutaminase-like superfamily